MLVRLKTSLTLGSVASLISVAYTLLEAIVLLIVEILFPVSDIDILPSFNPKTVIQKSCGQTKQYCDDPLAFGDHLLSVNSLKTHSADSTVNKNGAGEPIIIDLYKDKKKTNTQISQNKIEPIIRQVRQSNRYTIVKPQESDLKEMEDRCSMTERSGFSVESAYEDQSQDSSYSSNSSYVVDSQITTSAEKS